jgi:hypothetical protein
MTRASSLSSPEAQHKVGGVIPSYEGSSVDIFWLVLLSGNSITKGLMQLKIRKYTRVMLVDS